jgi:AcrR family transcriptional regulator
MTEKNDDLHRGRSRLRDRRRQVVQEEIVAAGVELIDEVGIDEFSVLVLADRLGMSDGNIYHYFSSRSELLERISLAAATEGIRQSVTAMEDAGTGTEALTAAVESAFEHGRSRWRRLWFVFGADAPRPERLPQEQLERIYEEMGKLFDGLEAKLEEQRKRGDLMPGVNPRLRGNVAQALIEGLLFSFYCAKNQGWDSDTAFDGVLRELKNQLIFGTERTEVEDHG